MRKPREKHLPPIDAALEGLAFKWRILEDDADGFRLINHLNIEGAAVDEVAVAVLRRACQLADGWTISGPLKSTPKIFRPDAKKTKS